MFSCCNIGKNTKTKIIVFSAIGIAIVAASYFVFTATNNGAALALFGILGFAACPAMCAVMGEEMWVASRFRNRKGQKINSNNDQEQSCCAAQAHRKENLENSP